MPLSRPLSKRSSAAEKPDKTASKPAGQRSLGDLAKMDLGELIGAFKLPRVPTRRKRSARASDRQLVGLDIEPGYVTAAQVSVNGAITVEKAAGAELAPEVVRDGEVVDVTALSEALKTLFAEHKLDSRVRLGIANQRIVVRTLELPPIEDSAELAVAVRFQAQDELPMSLDSAVIDYHPLGIVETPSGPRQRVVLVAARREMIARLLTAAREAGLRPEGIDLSAFALIRSLHVPGAPSDERTVYLSLGGLGNLAVAEGSVCHFTRVLSIGFESIAGEVAERLGVSVTDARSLLLRHGLEDVTARLDAATIEASLPPTAAASDSLSEPIVETSQPVYGAADDEGDAAGALASGEPAAIVRGLLVEGVRRIAVEIRNSLHYHAINGGDQGTSRVLVSGVMTQIPGFVPALANELELELELGTVREARQGAMGSVPAERLTIAAGLAVSEAPA